MEKKFQENGKQRKTEAAILLSAKIHFKSKTVIRDKEGHFVVIKRSIHF